MANTPSLILGRDIHRSGTLVNVRGVFQRPPFRKLTRQNQIVRRVICLQVYSDFSQHYETSQRGAPTHRRARVNVLITSELFAVAAYGAPRGAFYVATTAVTVPARAIALRMACGEQGIMRCRAWGGWDVPCELLLNRCFGREH
jgi:hypothetical protein